MTYELWHALTSQHHADFDTLDAIHDFMRENNPDSDIEFEDIDDEPRTQRIMTDGGFEWAVRGPPDTESPEAESPEENEDDDGMTYRLENPDTGVSRAEFDTLDELHEFVRKEHPDEEVEFREVDSPGRVEYVYVDGSMMDAVGIPFDPDPPAQYQ